MRKLFYIYKIFPGTVLVAIGALAVGMALGRHTAPQPASLLSLAGRSPAVLQAKAELELDGGHFPKETDNYLFQRIADGMPPLTGIVCLCVSVCVFVCVCVCV